ncbi:leucine rich repeat (LRR) protein [Sphaerotilus hippei]|uniref:Leucine rich repeat (LRR) protein n=1 Tax=Sphaerotilus hippei TaxID=744406 RepID=A0A318HB46_9BURK|nr:leucine-rich repeat-containing protein kinase family protein [Sphaerotilus hippei]PXW96117.1 leucine rich repeat (LRR) protein [Sphaerotilus hippei]
MVSDAARTPQDTLERLRRGALAGAVRLDLDHAGLSTLPPEVFGLADTLEVLNLSGNALDALPEALPRLHRLRVLFCSDNPFTELPEVLGRCASLEVVGFKACRIRRVAATALPPRLRWLILTDNQLESLPDELGRRPGLHKLMLAGNRLDTLPRTLSGCHGLELLRLSANRFEALPELLLDLPRLTWLACAGNPFADAIEAEAVAGRQAPGIAWSDLALGERLGEGASGVIHRACWQGADAGTEDVAVKLFKGTMTSDGLPRCEMDACTAAGCHPALIPVHGRLDAHPDGVDGLVLGLIDPVWRNLAGPPSLHSCTRDVYDPAWRLDVDRALRLAGDIASAAAHLHARGLVHGDLYAHNILWRADSGAALLGDFGAATFHRPDGSVLARTLQAMEVRALGLLLGELVQHLDAVPGDPRAAALEALATRCLHPVPLQRPTAATLAEALQRPH